MIKIHEGTKIFAYCPAGVVTGGAELLHQIVHVLNENMFEAYVVYFDEKGIVSPEIPSDYKKYNLLITDDIDDNLKNIVILYEGIFNKTKNIKHAQIILWWLSVDNFFTTSQKFLSVKDFFKWDFKYGLHILMFKIYNLIKGNNYFKNNISLSNLSKQDYLNGYQSEYAQNFLQNNGFKELLPLKDFINDEFFDDTIEIEKENIVLYNPKKGIEFTKKIINAFPQYKWIPLQNMSRSEMILTMRKAKVYIDFGFHPGKDRIPREAVMCGACVITGYEGSAGFFEDVSIFNQYKIESKKENIYKIGGLIGNILNDYEKHSLNFCFYRNRIKEEKEEFIKQILNIFKN